MSKGLGVTQKAILKEVIESGMYWGVTDRWLNLFLDYHKCSISRAVRSLVRGEYVLKESDDDGGMRIMPTTKGLSYYADRLTGGER